MQTQRRGSVGLRPAQVRIEPIPLGAKQATIHVNAPSSCQRKQLEIIRVSSPCGCCCCGKACHRQAASNLVTTGASAEAACHRQAIFGLGVPERREILDLEIQAGVTTMSGMSEQPVQQPWTTAAGQRVENGVRVYDNGREFWLNVAWSARKETRRTMYTLNPTDGGDSVFVDASRLLAGIQAMRDRDEGHDSDSDEGHDSDSDEEMENGYEGSDGDGDEFAATYDAVPAGQSPAKHLIGLLEKDESRWAASQTGELSRWRRCLDIAMEWGTPAGSVKSVATQIHKHGPAD